MNDEREVLTPNATCMLFGKSTEAVRRALAEGHVQSPGELRFGVRPIRLIDLNSAIAYWGRGLPAAYSFEDELAKMRWYGVSIKAYVHRDDTLEDIPFSRYRVLHFEPLLSVSLLEDSPTTVHFE